LNQRGTADPPLFQIPSGYVQIAPWLTIANKERELMARYTAELGLTPSSRTRLAVDVAHRPKPWQHGPASEYLD
jgi:phage terminase small subunit